MVEDAPLHHEAVQKWLRSGGHEVTALAEVRGLREGTLFGRDLDGEARNVSVADLDAALLDYYFPSPPWNGARLARELVRANGQIRILGMSSVAEKNDAMLREGALVGMVKRRFADLL